MNRWCVTVASSILLTLMVVRINGDAQLGDGGLSWGVTLQKCQQSAQAPCVFYGDQPEIEMKFGISNLEAVALAFPPLAEHIRVQILSEATTPLVLSVDWHSRGEQTIAGAHIGTPDIARRDLLLGSQDAARLSFTVRRADGLPLTAGSYAVTIDLREGLAKSMTASGALWQGRAMRAVTERFVIRQPNTAAEWASFHRLEANHLLGQRKTAEALAHVENWLRFSPGDRFALTSLGGAYFELDRPADAARVLEEALPAVLRDPELRHQRAFATLLAHSYMRLKDEANARRVLRLTRLPEDAIAATVERLRKR